MSSRCDPATIFMFNPLTAFFLSGVATQLFILICDCNPSSKRHRGETVILDSAKRIDRWQERFTNFCIEIYDEYKEDYEQSQFTDGSSDLNPFEVHSSMLIGATEMILHYTSRYQLSSKTLDNVSGWFALISSLKGTRLGNHFGIRNLGRLLHLCSDYARRTSPSHSLSILDHPHFSPGALFIRTMFVVHIHKDRFSQDRMILWEDCNSFFLSKYLHLKDYFTHTEGEDVTRMNNFSPMFPYIHHLPSKNLYEKWTLFDQVSCPVPIHDIFYQITVHIHGMAITFNSFNTTTNSLSYRESGNQAKDRDHLIAFESILARAQGIFDNELDKIINCEKQRQFQIKKRQKENRTETICRKRSWKRPTTHIPIWSFRFLFPSYNYFPSFDDDSESDVFAC